MDIDKELNKLTLYEINKIMDKCKHCWNPSCMCLTHKPHKSQREFLMEQQRVR